MVVWAIIGLTIFLGFFVCAIAINYCYKLTNHYNNKFIDIKSFDNGVPNGLKLINLGSTYAQHAFGTYDELEMNAFSFALPSQSLREDQRILKSYHKKLAPGCIVVIVAAACLFLFDEQPDETSKLRYHIVFPKDRKYPLKPITRFKAEWPILFHPKQVKYILRDDLKLKDFYEKYPPYMDANNSEKEMESLVQCWKRLFGLADLKQIGFSEVNEHTMHKNETILKDIVSFCKDNQFQPIIVVPPFSGRLNRFFSSEFKNAVINERLDTIAKEAQIPYFNYQDDEYFQCRYELFCDGGFRLNKRGSKQFIHRLANDLGDIGIGVSNKTMNELG